jgi:hypothetical protein
VPIILLRFEFIWGVLMRDDAPSEVYNPLHWQSREPPSYRIQNHVSALP